MTNHSSSSWLEDISPSIKRYQYNGKQQLNELLDAECDRYRQDEDASEWLLFEVDKDTFSQDFCKVEDTERSWSSFRATENLLLASIMPYEHSAAMGAFGNELIKALIPMGLGFALQTYSGATIKGDENSKQGDNGWGPNRPPPGHDRKWPTIVLEVAVSESVSKLQSDVRFWLREGQGKVKHVFTLAVDRNSPNITIDKWEPEGDREVCTQHVTVYQGVHKHLYSTGAPLTIEFSKLFLCDPEIPREKDIRFCENDLKEIATILWLAQGFDV